VKLKIRLIIFLTLSINFLFQEKSISHNKVNGGCESHCFKDNFMFNNSNSKKYQKIKPEYNKNINSCVNSNFCRG